MERLQGIILGLIGYYVYDKYIHKCGCSTNTDTATTTTATTLLPPVQSQAPISIARTDRPSGATVLY